MLSVIATPRADKGLLRLIRPRPIDALFGRKVEFSDGLDRFWLQVDWIRDLTREPLSPNEFLEAPYRPYGRFQIISAEVSRPLYLGPLACLHLALFEQGSFTELMVGGRPFGSTLSCRRKLYRIVRKWMDQDFGDQKLKIMAIDIRKIL